MEDDVVVDVAAASVGVVLAAEAWAKARLLMHSKDDVADEIKGGNCCLVATVIRFRACCCFAEWETTRLKSVAVVLIVIVGDGFSI